MGTSGSFWGWLGTGIATAAIGLALAAIPPAHAIGWTLVGVGVFCVVVALVIGMRARPWKSTIEQASAAGLAVGATPPDTEADSVPAAIEFGPGPGVFNNVIEHGAFRGFQRIVRFRSGHGNVIRNFTADTESASPQEKPRTINQARERNRRKKRKRGPSK
jgi:hypothetical protein